MEIYITDLLTGERMGIPMLPEKVRLSRGAKTASYSILRLGEARIPTGSGPAAISWSAKLPGKGYIRNTLGDFIKGQKTPSYIKEKHWMLPKKFIAQWDAWIRSKTRLRVMATGTGINIDAWLESYSGDFSGGQRDYDYTIQFVEARDLQVRIEGANESEKTEEKNERPAGQEPAKNHTVKKGDSLYSIAKRYLGRGARWTEIYELNKKLIDEKNKGKKVRKDTIYPGQVLALPER